MDIRTSFGSAGFPQNLPTPTPTSNTKLDRTSQVVTQVIPTALQALLTDAKVASGAASGAGATASITSGGGWLSTAGKGFGVLGAATGAFNLISQWGKSTPLQGAASGTAIGALVGSIFPGIGTAIGGAAGGIIGGLIGSIRSGKHQDQQARDAVRAGMVESGFLDKDYSLTLANGLTYNMGLDGGPRAELGGRRPFELDFEQPLVPRTITWLDPLVDMLMGGDKKLKTDFVGYLVNAVTTGAQNESDVARNVAGVFEKLGVPVSAVADWIQFTFQSGRFSEQQATVYAQGIREWQSLLRGNTGSASSKPQ